MQVMNHQRHRLALLSNARPFYQVSQGLAGAGANPASIPLRQVPIASWQPLPNVPALTWPWPTSSIPLAGSASQV
ncbi:hypothetical protein C4J85_3255 [Pseudomonas sp. R4-34-07]|nr:hypothetical protein C4J85_3255 [Pseudomonas sp. R4-34-07]